MPRFHNVYSALTKQTTQVPFTQEEEAAADAASAAAVLAKRFRDLNRVQFRFMVRKRNWGPAIEAALDAMPDGDDKLLAQTLYFDGDRFERNHPFFQVLAPAVGITQQDINVAWEEALLV